MSKQKKIVLTLIAVILLLVIAAIDSGKTMYDDPEYIAEGTVQCIHGWKDMEMLMPLTPYKEGTEIYNMAFLHFQGIMQDSGWVDSYRTSAPTDLKKSDKYLYNEIRESLSEHGITGVKSIKAYTFQYNIDEEITVYIAKIGRKWYTLSADIER